jgi:hypothetical protein
MPYRSKPTPSQPKPTTPLAPAGGATNFLYVPPPVQTGSKSILPDPGNLHPAFRAPLPTGPTRPQTGSTSITPAPAPQQTGAAFLYDAPRQFGPSTAYVGPPTGPAKPGINPKCDDRQNLPYSPPQSLQRPRNLGYDQIQDELRLGNTIDRSGGGKVSEPFTPEYPDNSTS